MISDEIREKLQNVIRGKLQEGEVDACSAVRNLLCKSFGTSPTAKSEFESRSVIKEKQVEFLRLHAHNNALWLESLPLGAKYLTEGGEAKVYLSEDGRYVFKVNDAVSHSLSTNLNKCALIGGWRFWFLLSVQSVRNTLQTISSALRVPYSCERQDHQVFAKFVH